MDYLKLALKFGPYVACAILAALLWSAWGSIGTLKTANERISEELTTATTILGDYSAAVTARDATIAAQNASINAIKATSDANRAAYEAKLAEARLTADAYRGRASELMALTAPDGELAQCRAARDLLVSELVQ